MNGIISQNPIKVLQVIGIMNRGGAETLIMNLYRAIDRDKIQFDFVVHTDERAAYDEEINYLGGKIYHCPRYKGLNHNSYTRWWNRFFSDHAGEYSIVHGHIGSTAAIYLSEAKKQNLFTIAHSHNTLKYNTLKDYAYKILSYRTRFVADWFFACSRQAGIDRYGRGVVQGNTYHLLNNAIDTGRFSFDNDVRAHMREALGVCDELLIGHVGRFEEQKNHIFIIDVFKSVKEKNTNAKLLLVGDGELKSTIRQKAENCEVEKAVIFTGVRSDVDRLMQAMDVLLFPSLFEGLPLTLVEAQTAGLPAVISERIPEDCILVDNLITTKQLKDSSAEWGEAVLSAARTQRKDYSKQVAEKGFDIKETAKWLETFYLEKSLPVKEKI